ncbi:OmpA family protein [Pseudoalteromonas denitrificans]|uniref:Outer membrane protein OmpA n=1 Tax=Pseudoalteromonas denitrificans DSM 6059 TaxID=1123010 RepID=A0A1I1RZP7_9GAMM|nr:OmpA family protein [Pseudoalteromonas denitrificans]SFD39784.1 Outer membrane protein OmpA [Pseudoalteromonas denitrificans DSM 6059]
MLLKTTLLPLFAASLILTGCASTNAEKGAAIGAISGAILGKATSNHKNKRAVFGAAIGAIAGAAIGDYMDKQEQEFRDELSGSGIEVVREGDNLRLIMPANITFATGQSYITSGFHTTLNDVAKVLVKFDKTLLSIEGHTDSSGAAAFNQNLSEQRAMSVKSYLMNQNILASRLNTVGYGESKPVASNNTAQNKALNRRVEIQIVPNKA